MRMTMRMTIRMRMRVREKLFSGFSNTKETGIN
jgi:hypothetical protein